MAVATEAPKRRALGKGLESLLPRAQASVAAEAPEATVVVEAETGKPREIPVGDIERNPFQTRSQFDENQLAELTASVSATGVVQPIVVRPLADGKYQLIAGERRWLASQRAGKATVPAIVKPASDEQTLEMTIVENLQRADLNPIEQARAFDRLARDFKFTQEQMAIRTGKERASVSNFLRLLKLPVEVQDKVAKGELSFGHAKALLPIEDPEMTRKTAQKVLALNLSVRQTETFVQALLHPERHSDREEKAKAAVVDPNVREAEDRLRRKLGLQVHIEDKKGRGRVIIEYSKLEDFDTLLEMLEG